MKAVSLLGPAAIVVLLAACGGHDAPGDGDSAQTATAEEALPKPDPEGGSVTGMPAKPGPGPVGPPPAVVADPGLPPEEALAGDPLAVAGDAQAVASAEDLQPATPGAAADPAAPLAEPSPADALAVVRGYYAALGSGNYARARALWSEGGAPGGNGASELAARYADTASLAVDAGAPGRVEAAAGSRYIRVPVTVVRTLRDGTTHRGAGVVTLRRAMVDGATPEQRAWRIASEELRELPQ